MESQCFDLLTQRLAAARSRRQALSALIVGAVAPLLPRPEANQASAKCKGYKANCKKNSNCCGQDGLQCRRDRCRCKKGWKRCPGSGTDCTHVKADPDNCGACGNECPPATPCCINGSCQPLCGGTCCADCFVDYNQGIPQIGTETCCGPGSGTFCSAKKGESDDECCYPDHECLDGHCCCDNCEGTVICGGKCCASVACCNGKCCPEGEVCGMTPDGPACVSANRECTDCLDGEECLSDVCCPGDRRCGNAIDGDFCCPVGQYCDTSLGLDQGGCCELNVSCKSTYRGHRARR